MYTPITLPPIFWYNLTASSIRAGAFIISLLPWWVSFIKPMYVGIGHPSFFLHPLGKSYPPYRWNRFCRPSGWAELTQVGGMKGEGRGSWEEEKHPGPLHRKG